MKGKIEMEEDNGYFQNVVKEALNDLKHNSQAYVFFIEQVKAVKEELKVEEKEGVYYLTKIK